MRLAIMQPYVFPYIGYFQLIAATDRFVFYDDVNFIKRGWINRNRILNNGAALTFTIPLENASQFSKIRDVQIDPAQFEFWRSKFLKTLELNYKNAPFFKPVFEMVSDALGQKPGNIAECAKQSIQSVCAFIGLAPDFVASSTRYNNQHLSGQERIISICMEEQASEYINAIGGQSLYTPAEFDERNLSLKFLQTGLVEYSQFKSEFVPSLSIIDVLMFNEPQRVREYLANYELV